MTEATAPVQEHETAAPAAEEGPKVRFEVGGKELDLSKVNRVARRLLEGQAKKYRKKFAETVGPHGEVPTVVVRSTRLMDPKVEIVLEYPESMKDVVKGHEKAVRVA